MSEPIMPELNAPEPNAPEPNAPSEAAYDGHGSFNAEVHSEGLPPPAAHKPPSALGLDAGGWAALAMIAVAVLLVVKKAPAAITRMLDGKIEAIRHQLYEAKALRSEAQALQLEYQAKAKAAEADAAALHARAEAEARAILEKAEQDAADLVARRARMAEEKIAAAEAAALAELRVRTVSVAARAAAQLIARHNDAANDHALVDRVIETLDRPR